MAPWAERAYGLGRLAFGAGLIAAPDRAGALLMGPQARGAGVRVALRAYRTRDTVLGAGVPMTSRTGDPAPWIRAGIASAFLDAALQIADWKHLPPGRRELGVAAAAVAAASGIGLLLAR